MQSQQLVPAPVLLGGGGSTSGAGAGASGGGGGGAAHALGGMHAHKSSMGSVRSTATPSPGGVVDAAAAGMGSPRMARVDSFTGADAAQFKTRRVPGGLKLVTTVAGAAPGVAAARSPQS